MRSLIRAFAVRICPEGTFSHGTTRFIFISDAFYGDIALSEEEYKEYRYIEEKMNTSIYELQIEDPNAMQGTPGNKYSKYEKSDLMSEKHPTKSSSKVRKNKDSTLKRKKRRCKKR